MSSFHSLLGSCRVGEGNTQTHTRTFPHTNARTHTSVNYVFFFTQGGRATTRPGPLISVHWDLKTEPVLRPEPEYFIFHV